MCVFICVTTVKVIINKYRLCFAFGMDYFKPEWIFLHLKGNYGRGLGPSHGFR